MQHILQSSLPLMERRRPVTRGSVSGGSAPDLREFNLPRLDFEGALREQLARAESLRQRIFPKRSLAERLFDYIEGPWAPERSDLPDKKVFPSDGPAACSFRKPALSKADAKSRARLKKHVCSTESRWSLSRWSSVYEYEVPIKGLPQALDGLTILHLSDIHFLKSHEQPQRELSLVAKLLEQGKKRVDLILLSGDVITRSPDDLSSYALRQLRRMSDVCPQAFMVYGNHDYHGHTPAVISRELEKVGFHDINNDRVTLSLEGQRLNIFGIDDAYFGNPVPPLGVREDETNIVLTHNLDAIRADFPAHIDLILSGHTHWGEVKFFDGASFMRWWGYCDNINRHTKHWDVLSDRTLSYVHPGLARYYVPFQGLRHPPGVAIHTLRQLDESGA